MTIFRKLVLVGALALLGLVSLALYASSLIGQFHEINTEIEDIGVIEGVPNALGIDIERYLAEQDSAYVSSFDAKVQHAKDTIEHLNKSLAHQNSNLDVSELIVSINDVYDKFHAVEQLELQIGLDENSGLRGDLRAAVRDAENLISLQEDYFFISKILTLRRTEKDFLLRLDEKYVQRFNTQLADVRQYLANSPDFTSSTKLKIGDLLTAYADNFIALTQALEKLGFDSHTGLHGELTEADHHLQEFSSTLHKEFIAWVDGKIAKAKLNTLFLSVGFTIVVIGLIGYLVLGIQRRQQSINSELKTFVGELEQNRFDYSSRITTGNQDELNDIAIAINAFLVKLESLMQNQLAILRESNRNKLALDVADTPIMLADNDMNIIYVNQSANEMMSVRGEALKQALPKLDYQNLVGTNVDSFHKNPAHQRSLVGKLTSVFHSQIEVAKLTFGLTATPLFDKTKERIGTVIEWEDRTEALAKQTEELRISQENLRIRQALDNVTTNTMIADKDRNIVYVNKSVHAMLKSREAELRAVLPNFNADNLIGENIDLFHKNPAHQKGLLEAMKQTHKAQIKVADLHFGLTANPVYDNDGDRIGSVVEWEDRTLQVTIQNEIDVLINSASHGDLSKRIDIEGKEGFFANLSEGLNRLVQISEGVVGDTARVFSALSHGDLSQKIETHYEGAFGELKTDANATVQKLTEIITQIREASSTVSTGADEIAQGNADLSQRTEEQASSLEETASSMEEMTSAVRTSADNALQANDIAGQTQELASSGGDVVQDAVRAMAEINESSKHIADIIGVIDEIAFQTNLLALNAAVEAARAGEQGRGFAVVASEVRNLAQRSAGAAKEIKDLIRDSVDKVATGSELVNRSGDTLEEIVASVQKVSSMVKDISNSAHEQSGGIEQVNKAVSQMDEMTQQNAALVEEATAAGEAMAEQARKLMQQVSFFSLDGNQAVDSYDSFNSEALEVVSNHAVEPNTSLRNNGSSGQGGMEVTDENDEWEEF